MKRTWVQSTSKATAQNICLTAPVHGKNPFLQRACLSTTVFFSRPIRDSTKNSSTGCLLHIISNIFSMTASSIRAECMPHTASSKHLMMMYGNACIFAITATISNSSMLQKTALPVLHSAAYTMTLENKKQDKGQRKPVRILRHV